MRAQVVAAGAQLAGGHLGVADVEHQQRLDRVDVVPAHAVELVLDQVEQAAVEPLDAADGFEIERLQRYLRLSGTTASAALDLIAIFASLFCRLRDCSRLMGPNYGAPK